jgi:flagellar export protein FliJ
VAFKFPLASVLRLRESIEQREELALQKSQFELARTIRRIDELADEIAQAVQKRDEALGRAMEAYRLQDLEVGINAAKETRQALTDSLETLKSNRDRQMKVYQAARSGRQMLTDLLAQRKSEWEQEQVRIQQKRLDDIFAARLQRG